MIHVKNEGPAAQREMLLRLVTTALLLYALTHFAASQMRLARTEALTEALTAERDALAAENAALSGRLRGGESREALEARAREELGLVRPGEIVFYFEDGEED